MSLTIHEAVMKLGTKLGVDMTNAPASNIADTIDYITDHVYEGAEGAHTGVIAEAIDEFEFAEPEPLPDESESLLG